MFGLSDPHTAYLLGGAVVASVVWLLSVPIVLYFQSEKANGR